MEYHPRRQVRGVGRREDPINDAAVQVQMRVERRTEAVDEHHRPLDGRPRFVKRSINDGEKVKIAAIDPDFA
jgi:hypothetical protein